MNADAENWADLHDSSLTRSGLKTQLALLQRQFAKQCVLAGRSVQQRVCPQQHRGVRQQGHAPSQSQAVEEHRAQSQLVLLVRLRRFNPPMDLLQQAAGGRCVERQQPQQGFVRGRRVGTVCRQSACRARKGGSEASPNVAPWNVSENSARVSSSSSSLVLVLELETRNSEPGTRSYSARSDSLPGLCSRSASVRSIN